MANQPGEPLIIQIALVDEPVDGQRHRQHGVAERILLGACPRTLGQAKEVIGEWHVVQHAGSLASDVPRRRVVAGGRIEARPAVQERPCCRVGQRH